MSWFDKLHQTFIEGDRYLWILDGLKNTLIITLGALLIGVLIGALIAITKYFCDGDKKLRIFMLHCVKSLIFFFSLKNPCFLEGYDL